MAMLNNQMVDNVPGYKPLYFLRISQPAKFDKTEGKIHHTQPGYD